MECEQWRYGEGRLLLRMHGAIAVLEFSGLVSALVMTRLLERAIQARGDTTAGWVTDYTRAAITIQPADMMAVSMSAPPGHVLRRPGAFVVQAHMAAMFREYATAVSAANPGLIRRAFQRFPAAFRWVSSVAELPGGGVRHGLCQQLDR